MIFTVKDEDIEEIIATFKIDVDSPQLAYKGSGIEVYEVSKPDYPSSLKVFTVDTWEAILLACKPSIVSEKFAELNKVNSCKSVAAIMSLVDELSDCTPVFVHVLRAGPGYYLHEAFKQTTSISEVYLRAKYLEESTRDHASERRVAIIYEDLSQLPENESIVLVKPDTVATGRTGIAVLRRIIEACEERNCSIEALVLYGFLSKYGMLKEYECAVKSGVRRVYAFALVDVTSLAYNMYDMVLYGIDESYYIETGKIRNLGSTVSRQTLAKCLPLYAPGMDQPGDWSARQDKLFNGHGYEDGDIEVHLARSLEIAKRLWRISKEQPWFKEWHDEVFKNVIRDLEKEIKTRQKVKA